MADKTIRVITRASNGTLRTKDFQEFDDIAELHEQVGVDDCSTDLTLRGMPIFRGLVGPMPESKTVVRYESPEVFENLTQEWSQAKTKRRRRKAAKPAESVETTESPATIPIPKMNIPGTMITPQVNV
jgi:hypothetical protein